jgi:hypothetical protein
MRRRRMSSVLRERRPFSTWSGGGGHRLTRHTRQLLNQIVGYKETVRPKVPPFHYSMYDLILSKKMVQTMNRFITMNPDMLYEFWAGRGEKVKELEAAYPERCTYRAKSKTAHC